MIQKQMKTEFKDADAKLSRSAGEIQMGYCSYSGIVGGGTIKLMCFIVPTIQQRFVNSCCLFSQEYWWWSL